MALMLRVALLSIGAAATPLHGQGALPEWGRPLAPAEGRELRAEIGRLARRLSVRETTLVAIARVLGANLRSISFPELVRQIQAQAVRAADLQTQIGALRNRVAALTDDALRGPAEQALARATAAFDEGRLEDAGREFLALESLRRSESEAARAAWLEAVEARARIAELQLDYDTAVDIRLSAAGEERRHSREREWRLVVGAAEARARQGEIQLQPAALENALAIMLNQALPLVPRPERPRDWAMTQHILGNILSIMGTREQGSGRLEQAVNAYRSALTEFRRDREPEQWARSMIGLGNASSSLGERENGTANLEAAIAAYRDALEVLTRQRAPLEWAMAQVNLGNALSSLGERERGTARLQEAVAALRLAMEEYSRDGAPFEWATAQNNLGAVFAALASRETGTASLSAAATAFRAALEIRTRDRMPMQWATTTANLSHILAEMAARTGEPALLDAAERSAREALAQLQMSGHAAGASSAALILRRIATLRAEMAGTTSSKKTNARSRKGGLPPVTDSAQVARRLP